MYSAHTAMARCPQTDPYEFSFPEGVKLNLHFFRRGGRHPTCGLVADALNGLMEVLIRDYHYNDAGFDILQEEFVKMGGGNIRKIY